MLNPGEVYKFTVDLWSTSNVFLKGQASAPPGNQQQ